MERSLNPAGTDWDSYYARPYRTASLTRKYTASVLVDLLRNHGGGGASILEFGGANSCFIEQILDEIAPARYDIVDNNQLGLDLLKCRYPRDERVSVIRGDVLSMPEPERLYDIVFSVGLIEHFDPAGTALAVAAHFKCREPAAPRSSPFPRRPGFIARCEALPKQPTTGFFTTSVRFGWSSSKARLRIWAGWNPRVSYGL
jgi:hypothetical protein